MVESFIEYCIQNELKKLAVEFPKIGAIHKGVTPEEGSPCYYVLTQDPKFDEKLSIRISELEIELTQMLETGVSISHWPVGPEKAKEYGFIKERIYLRK